MSVGWNLKQGGKIQFTGNYFYTQFYTLFVKLRISCFIVFYFVNMFDCYFIHVSVLIKIHNLKLFYHALMTDQGFHIFL